MTAELIAAWATVASSAFAGAGLFFTAYQIGIQSRGQDAEWLFRWHSEIRDMERRLARSEAADQRANFVETMNLLNICAKACREKLFPKRTRALAESYVVQAIANIHSIPELRSDIEAMMTSSTTFRDLAAFALANRPAIALANEEVRALLEAEASRHSPPEIENR